MLSEEKVSSEIFGEPVLQQVVEVGITSGKFKGKKWIVTNEQSNNPVFDIRVKQGDAVVLYIDVTDGEIRDVFISDYLRQPYIYALVLLFIVLLLAIGWRQGLKTMAALFLTLVLVWGVLLPGFLHGYNPLLVTVLVSVLATAVTMVVVGGFSLKSLAAICGTLCGVLVAGLLALSVGKLAHLTGFGNEEAAMLLYIPQKANLDIQGLLFAGIIIGALGAAMDVSMSIASAVYELKCVNPQLTVGELIRSGLNVGRDILGTMANTLILAYTGSSLQLILVFMAYRESIRLSLGHGGLGDCPRLRWCIGMVVIPLAVVSSLLFGRCRRCCQDDKKIFLI